MLKHQPNIEYKAAKKGVDMSDQMSSYHTNFRNPTKWYRKFDFELLTGTSVVNSWILYNKITAKPIYILKFKESFVENITYLSSSESSPATNESPTINIKQFHVLDEDSEPKQKVHKRFRLCYDTLAQIEGSIKARTSSKKVTTFFASCEGKPFFCLSCFIIKHADINMQKLVQYFIRIFITFPYVFLSCYFHY